MFPFHVITGQTARSIISGSRSELVKTVEDTYLAHDRGESVNPNSYFLKFPDKPDSRIIALPAYLGGENDVAGIKWIGSFPGNIESGIPRASAVLLLNDYTTGYPFACLEASQISAARTAASAALAAERLTGGRRAGTVAVIGSGIIARNILEFFAAQQWHVDSFAIHDQNPQYSQALADYTQQQLGYSAHTALRRQEAVSGADVVILATTAGTPYITEPDDFSAGQVVLNISLRDIGPEVVRESYNILDDIEHCLTAGTSPHLAEQKYGHRGFITGTLADVIKGRAHIGDDKPVVFSPFGLGVLDLAVGMHVYHLARNAEETVPINDFFAETQRWSPARETTSA
ncbi:2,3-diaminopropionate biosynthesis protein SbnB [Nocardiopsis gilva YIM 90087]|uniref:2,3-diaminopropionate biosynthesis protein SbnB n=2 Tax=Nocardiopsis gilva TaxID=280236 RepID=A0A223SAF9_9ACTN|nr:2,3-diaminopropionate biosynthesis protein SbnB [Nocardiopsis gilva]ASU85039.1 2,3-diaminopropionate biosynthesis protein SbnB [Nocardiopsis gilva YIM 90087]